MLLPEDGANVIAHGLGADLHIADRVEAVGIHVAFPDLDALRHQLAHGRLEVIVAHHAAGDAGGPGGDTGFVEHQNIGAGTSAPGLKFKRQMIGGAEAMDAGADDDVFRVGGKCHFGVFSSYGRGWSESGLTKSPIGPTIA